MVEGGFVAPVAVFEGPLCQPIVDFIATLWYLDGGLIDYALSEALATQRTFQRPSAIAGTYAGCRGGGGGWCLGDGFFFYFLFNN